MSEKKITRKEMLYADEAAADKSIRNALFIKGIVLGDIIGSTWPDDAVNTESQTDFPLLTEASHLTPTGTCILASVRAYKAGLGTFGNALSTS